MYYVMGYTSRYTARPNWRETLAVSEAELPTKVQAMHRAGFKTYVRPATGDFTTRRYTDAEVAQAARDQRRN